MFISQLKDTIRTTNTRDECYHYHVLKHAFKFSFGQSADRWEPRVPLSTLVFFALGDSIIRGPTVLCETLANCVPSPSLFVLWTAGFVHDYLDIGTVHCTIICSTIYRCTTTATSAATGGVMSFFHITAWNAFPVLSDSEVLFKIKLLFFGIFWSYKCIFWP